MKKNKRDNNDAFDEHGMLRDGRSLRVSMQMRDSLQRRTPTGSRVTDGSDNPSALNKPGYRVIGDTAARDAKAAALRDYESDLTTAWRKPICDDDNGYGVEGAEGTVCTVKNESYPGSFGSPGHIVNGICVPDDDPDSAASDSRPARDQRQAALAAYDAELRDAWRTK
jgi:hypothetical protein